MNITNTPSAWAIKRNKIYCYGGLSLFALVLLVYFGLISRETAGFFVSILIPTVLLAGVKHVWAILTGNTQQQEIERQAWSVASRPLTRGFQGALRSLRRSCTSSKNHHPLHEIGAIGGDLIRTHARQAGRQSGSRKTGTGGHKKPSSGDSDDGDGGEPPAHLPLLWTIRDLAAVLQVSPKTLQNKPHHHLPPAIRIPGCRGPRYRLRDVMAWLDAFESNKAQITPRKPLGRPRIALSLGKGGVQ